VHAAKAAQKALLRGPAATRDIIFDKVF